MKEPDVDDLLEKLEEAHEQGRHLTVEDVCVNHPELVETVRERWQKLIRFNAAYCTRRESTAEVERKVSAMPENMNGKHVVVQAELRIDDFVDRGGLGDVYRAEDTELAREVAIKLLRADRQTESNEEDFEREVRILGGMVHPGIMSIYGGGETIDGRKFYTMPYVDRGTLRSAVMEYHARNRNRVDDTSKEFRDLVYRMVSVCKTIAYAHSRGIVHRDLKTENILLGKYGETFVIDWGCATKVKRGDKFKISGEATLELGNSNESTGAAGLTLRYASPEQLHGNRDIGPESDIYGLGAMLYLLLSGSSPLETTPDEEVRKTVIAGNVPSPETLKQGVSHRMSAICAKAMATVPANRYETAMDMAEDLERYLADETVSVCADSLGVKVSRIVRRNRTASILLIGTLLLASGLLTLLLIGNSKQRIAAVKSAERANKATNDMLGMSGRMVSAFGGAEVERRFAKLEEVAKDLSLAETMQKLSANPEAKELRDGPDKLLRQLKLELRGEMGIQCENLFITDAHGTQIAREPLEDSIGNGYWYRMYYHGQPDISKDTPEEQRLKPTTKPVLTLPYISTNPDDDGKRPVKVSFSVPVFADPSDKDSQVVGILGMSVQVNDLQLFKELAGSGSSVEALVVEAGDYDWGSKPARGLMLDHLNAKVQPMVASTEPSTGEKVDLDKQKDRMDRLSGELMDRIKMQLGDHDFAVLDDVHEPLISDAAETIAVTKLDFPGRDIMNDWIVILVAAHAEELDAAE